MSFSYALYFALFRDKEVALNGKIRTYVSVPWVDLSVVYQLFSVKTCYLYERKRKMEKSWKEIS